MAHLTDRSFLKLLALALIRIRRSIYRIAGFGKITWNNFKVREVFVEPTEFERVFAAQKQDYRLSQFKSCF